MHAKVLLLPSRRETESNHLSSYEQVYQRCRRFASNAVAKTDNCPNLRQCRPATCEIESASTRQHWHLVGNQLVFGVRSHDRLPGHHLCLDCFEQALQAEGEYKARDRIHHIVVAQIEDGDAEHGHK